MIDASFVDHPIQTGIFCLIFFIIGYILFGTKSLTKIKITNLEFHTVKEQMKKSEEIADLVEDSVLRLYLKMRKEARGSKSGLMKDDEVQHFQLMLKYLKKKALKNLRHSFRENHLAERENFEIWIDTRSEEILRNLRELLNAWFPVDSDPGLEHFYDRYLIEKRNEAKESIKSALREGKQISVNFHDKKFVKNYFKTIGV